MGYVFPLGATKFKVDSYGRQGMLELIDPTGEHASTDDPDVLKNLPLQVEMKKFMLLWCSKMTLLHSYLPAWMAEGKTFTPKPSPDNVQPELDRKKGFEQCLQFVLAGGNPGKLSAIPTVKMDVAAMTVALESTLWVTQDGVPFHVYRGEWQSLEYEAVPMRGSVQLVHSCSDALYRQWYRFAEELKLVPWDFQCTDVHERSREREKAKAEESAAKRAERIAREKAERDAEAEERSSKQSREQAEARARKEQEDRTFAEDYRRRHGYYPDWFDETTGKRFMANRRRRR